MQRINLLCIGQLREQWAKDAARLYADRLKHAFDFTVTELVPSRQPNASGQQVEESERLLISAEKTKGELWVLDETGTEMTSQEFAEEIGKLRDRGDAVTFILGGSYGLTDKVRSSAKRVISLGKMTLPHELCRIVFLEQLYRASEILKGSGYHH
jgi:23S rRNA (pseudouridine1915-N3)-methyltransferase